MCTQVCVYTLVSVCICMCLCVYIYACLYVHLCKHMCLHVCACRYICACVCLSMCVQVCHVHTSGCLCVCMCVCLCVYTCARVCVCMCVHGCVGKVASFRNLVLGLALALQGTVLRAPARAWRLSRALEAGSAPPSPFRAPPRLVKASHKLSTSLGLEGRRGRPPSVGTGADKHSWDTCRSSGTVLRALGPSHSVTPRSQETSAGSHGR